MVSFIIPFFRSFCPTTKFRLLSNAFGQMFVTSPNSSTFFWWIWSESETHWRPFHSAYFWFSVKNGIALCDSVSFKGFLLALFPNSFSDFVLIIGIRHLPAMFSDFYHKFFLGLLRDFCLLVVFWRSGISRVRVSETWVVLVVNLLKVWILLGWVSLLGVGETWNLEDIMLL